MTRLTRARQKSSQGDQGEKMIRASRTKKKMDACELTLCVLCCQFRHHTYCSLPCLKLAKENASSSF